MWKFKKVYTEKLSSGRENDIILHYYVIKKLQAVIFDFF